MSRANTHVEWSVSPREPRAEGPKQTDVGKDLFFFLMISTGVFCSSERTLDYTQRTFKVGMRESELETQRAWRSLERRNTPVRL